MEEIWKPVPTFEGFYEVSNMGQLRCLDRVIFYTQERYRFRKGFIMKQRVAVTGYIVCSLYQNARVRHTLMHRLVAEVFIPNPENKPQVNHKDAVKSNNIVSNLEWATPMENSTHAKNMGLLPIMVGEDRFKSKLKEYQVREIHHLKTTKQFSAKELAAMYGMAEVSIYRIARGVDWKHLKLNEK